MAAKNFYQIVKLFMFGAGIMMKDRRVIKVYFSPATTMNDDRITKRFFVAVF